MRLAVSIDGGVAKIIDTDTENVIKPISVEDTETVLAGILKLYSKGKTKAQIRSGLELGLVVTI